MRVLHCHPHFLAGGRVANAVLGLAQGQAGLGAAVGVATLSRIDPPRFDPMDRGSGISLLQWEPGRTAGAAGMLARWVPQDAARALRAFRPDVVHVHGEFSPDNLWVPLLFKGPIILSPHGGFHAMVFPNSPNPINKYFSIAKYMLYRRVRIFHALSRLERADLMRLFPGATMYCAPAGPGIRTQVHLQPTEGDRSDDVVRFVFVGRLDVFTKGLDFLLEAVAEAEARLRERRQIMLTLVGPDCGESRAWLVSRKKRLGIASRVTFTGEVPAEEVGRILRQSDVYVQLSRYDDFALGLTEALCAGKPAVMSATAGHASYPEVTSLPHVRVVPLAAKDAAAAMTDFALRLPEFKALAEQNRAKVQAFCSWDRVAGLHLQMYESARRAGKAPEKPPSREPMTHAAGL